jgi:rhodanese-related sulfurtransferase
MVEKTCFAINPLDYYFSAIFRDTLRNTIMKFIKNTIEPTELFSVMHTEHAPIVIDVVRPQAFKDVDRMIAGAIWKDHMSAGEWSLELPRNKDVVINCVHGHNVSQIAVTYLRAKGINARYLNGGVAAWEAAGGTTVSRDKINSHQSSEWITRESPKIDRIACPWLIRRFIDPNAVFHYVSTEFVRDIAEETGATVFDIDDPDITFTHKGEQCSFDAFITHFDIRDPALKRLADIVRGADTNRLDLAPQAAGLVALSLGLSATYSDDLEMLEKGMVLYDALYSWCRNVSDETHNWTRTAA